MYDFSPLVQAGIAIGKYVPVKTAAGVPIGMVRDASTGRFVAHAVGMATNPLTAAPQLLMSGAQLYQGQQALQGIKVLQASVSALQATTALIGVGTAATVALSAVNLWQTLKLRKDVRQMRVEVQEGFVDLKQVLSEMGSEVITQIQKVSEDVEFQNHRTILARAYGLFDKALRRLESAVIVRDSALRKDEITAARSMMMKALADYDNGQIMSGIGAAAYVRRRECVWAIEQAIAMTYQMQGEWQAVSDRLTNLSTTIHKDVRRTLGKFNETQEELDFLFPELSRIRDHDLVAIEAWYHHADWYQSLPSEALKQLNELVANEEHETEEYVSKAELVDQKPSEQSFYEEAKSKFLSQALYDSLVYSFDTRERQATEVYIQERASLESSMAFSAETLRQASPLTVANLALYLESRDESLVETEESEFAEAVT